MCIRDSVQLPPGSLCPGAAVLRQLRLQEPPLGVDGHGARHATPRRLRAHVRQHVRRARELGKRLPGVVHRV
eukprot:8703239-Alexandrium_andersonii.AAC.1